MNPNERLEADLAKTVEESARRTGEKLRVALDQRFKGACLADEMRQVCAQMVADVFEPVPSDFAEVILALGRGANKIDALTRALKEIAGGDGHMNHGAPMLRRIALRALEA